MQQVYLFHLNGAYKIGVSNCVGARLREVAPGGDYVWAIESIQPFAVERAIHRKFADKALGGEWFDLDPEDIEAFCSITRAYHVEDLPDSLRPPPKPVIYGMGFKATQAMRDALVRLAEERGTSMSEVATMLIQEGLVALDRHHLP